MKLFILLLIGLLIASACAAPVPEPLHYFSDHWSRRMKVFGATSPHTICQWKLNDARYGIGRVEDCQNWVTPCQALTGLVGVLTQILPFYG